jgi:hypothetical protein
VGGVRLAKAGGALLPRQFEPALLCTRQGPKPPYPQSVMRSGKQLQVDRRSAQQENEITQFLAQKRWF